MQNGLAHSAMGGAHSRPNLSPSSQVISCAGRYLSVPLASVYFNSGFRSVSLTPPKLVYP